MRSRLEEGVSLSQVSPTLTSGLMPWTWFGGGAHLGDGLASGLWSQERDLSINARELLAVERGLLHFASQFGELDSCCLRGQFHCCLLPTQSRGDSFSSPQLYCSADSQVVRVGAFDSGPQFIMGKDNVLVDALSLPNQILGSEWTLKWEVFQDLRKRWLVMFDLFTTSSNHQYWHTYNVYN